MLNGMLNHDRMTVIAPDGTRREGVRCQFTPPLVVVPDKSLDIDRGFTVERALPNGRVESYVVSEVKFYDAGGLGGIPAFYEVTVARHGHDEERRREEERQSTPTVYNISGPNARLNVASTDSSVNVAQIEEGALFDRLRQTADEIDDSEVRAKTLKAITEMESTAGTSDFLISYQQFIGVAADHVTLFSPFLPALAQYLV